MASCIPGSERGVKGKVEVVNKVLHYQVRNFLLITKDQANKLYKLHVNM